MAHKEVLLKLGIQFSSENGASIVAKIIKVLTCGERVSKNHVIKFSAFEKETKCTKCQLRAFQNRAFKGAKTRPALFANFFHFETVFQREK